MTTGSWSTMRETPAPTDCSGSGVIRNGTTVSWVGGDSSPLARRRMTFRERHVRFLKDPSILPNGRPAKLPVNATAAASRGASSNIFDASREKRIRIAEGVPEQSEYSTPNAYVKNWTTLKETVFPWASPGGSFTGTVSSCGFEPEPIGNPFTPEDDYKLVDRLRNKVVGTEFNLGSFLGAEGLDTLRFLADTANRIYRSGVAMKKADVRGAHRVITEWGRAPTRSASRAEKTIQEDVYRDLIEAVTGKSRKQSWFSLPASTWLEWHLAVRPLLGDCVAAAEQLAHITEMPRTQKVRASVTKRGIYPEVATGAVWEGQRTVRKAIVAYFTATPEPMNFLGLQDPEVVIWNALPLSFVSDYFYDIGGFLSARANARAFGEGLFVTSFKDETRYTSCLGRRFNGGMVSVVDLDARVNQKQTFGFLQRTVSPSIDVPAPSFDPLGYVKNWQRAATVASLIATTFDRHARLPALR